MKNFAATPTFLLLFALLILNNCSRKVSEVSSNKIEPPFKNVNVAFTENSIDGAAGGEINFDNGTKITIPENAFADAGGIPVKSKVKIKYREFHNSAQILMSGIPMKFGDQNFQTAGMFEISGVMDNNEVVQLAKDKTVKVQMASFVNGNEYSFYYFDEDKGQWILKGANEPQINEEKKSQLEMLSKQEDPPLKPVKQQTNSMVFDLEINSALYPELRDFNGVVWQYAGSKPENNPEKTPWVFTEKWSLVEIARIDEDSHNYTLNLKSNKHEYSTIVSPVLNGKYYKEALAKFEKRMTAYESAYLVRKEEVMQLSREADLLRTFTVSNFGIYNWDSFYKNKENAVRLAADFKLNKEIDGVDMNKITVYLITASQRALIPYDQYSKANFSFNPDVDNKLVAVLPGNRMAVLRNEDFKTAANSISNAKNNRYTFLLEVLEDQIVNADNLTSVIANI